jgi:hypothetical protein
MQDCKSWESGSIFPGWMVFYCKGKYKNMKHCISLIFLATFHPLNRPHCSIIEVGTPGPRYPFVKLSKLKLDHDHHRGLYSAHHDLQIPSGKHTNNYGTCPIYSDLSHETWGIFPWFFVCFPEGMYSIYTSFCWRFLLFLWWLPPILAHRWLLSTWGHHPM